MNQRPSGYEPDELPDCSTPRYLLCAHQLFADCSSIIPQGRVNVNPFFKKVFAAFPISNGLRIRSGHIQRKYSFLILRLERSAERSKRFFTNRSDAERCIYTRLDHFLCFFRQKSTPAAAAITSTTTGQAPARLTASCCRPLTKFDQPSAKAVPTRVKKPSLVGV